MPADDVVIVPYRDGPYLVRGPLILRDQDGREIELSRRTVALCRCGKSRMRPFCDGTHRLVQFRASSEAEDPWETPAEPAAPRAEPRPVAPTRAGVRRARARVRALLENCEQDELRAALAAIDAELAAATAEPPCLP
jgi:CDGSH-type Zn-finger protein